MQNDCTSDTHNDSHRATKTKESHANNGKKPKKPKGNPHVPTQEEQSIRIFQNMQEQVRSRLTCCEPGRELEVNECTEIIKME